MSLATVPASQATIPASFLYWGRLPPDARRLSWQALRYRFERLLPVPIEQVHTVSTELPDGGLVIIGIEPERLRAFLATRTDLGPGTWTLVPDAAPDHLTAAGISRVHLDRLNLLIRAFEPASRRRQRLLATCILHGGLALALALTLAGIQRRSAACDRHAVALQQSTREALTQALPPQPGVQINPELRLTMELRTLEQAARSPIGVTTLDVAAVLDRFFSNWPSDLRVQAETITATPERIVVRGVVPNLADAERLAKVFSSVSAPGFRYRAEPLQAQSGEHGASFLLTLVRQTVTP